MKKRRLAIYIVYIVICILITFVKARQYEKTIQVDKYGLSTDGTVELLQDYTIESEFQLKYDGFQGISIKFQANCEFQNELLKATLYDTETQKILAEDTIELCNERIQNKDSGSTIFLELPIKESVNKKVRLVLELKGEEIYVNPLLVTSKTKVEQSTLVVNGTEKDENLVFTTRYVLGEKRDIFNSITNGILWILIGSLIYGSIVVGVQEEQAFINKEKILDKIYNKINSIWARYKKICGYIILIVISIIAMIYVYQYSVEPLVNMRSESEVLGITADAESIFLNKSNQKISQSFLCDKNKLSGIFFSLKIHSINENAGIFVVLIDETTGKTLSTKQIELADYYEENKEIKCGISLEETLENSANHRLKLEITTVGFEKTVLEFLASQKKEIDDSSIILMENETALEGYNIYISAEYGNVSFLIPMFKILCFLIITFISVFYFCCFIKKICIEKLFIITAIMLGSIYGLLIGLNTVPDEPSHIDTAYSISNKMLGIQESSKPGYLYKRAEDVDPIAEEKQSLNEYSYERLYKQLFSTADDETLVECAGRNNLGNASEIYYFPQALGITIGRLFHLGMMPTMMIARLFSLLCYIFCTYKAIRKLPFGKTTFFIIGILPITLQQAASLSYDAMINAVAFLFVCYSLNLIYNEQEFKITDIAVIAITGSMIAMVKGGVYVPLCALPLLALYVRKSLSKKQKNCIITVVLVCGFAFLKRNLVRTLLRFTTEQGTVTGGSASTEIYTFGYLLKYPQRFIGMFVNTIYKQGDSYIRNVLGGNLAWREVNISWFVVIGFLIVLLISCIGCNNKEKKVNVIEKVFFAAVSFASYFTLELSMLLVWTPTTCNYITGVQGRYFLPFLLIVFLIFRGTKIQLKENIDKKLIFGAGLLNILTVLQVIQYALK